MYANVYRTFTGNCPKLETPEMSLHWGMNKHNVEHPLSGIMPQKEKEPTTDIPQNKDESKVCYATWKEPTQNTIIPVTFHLIKDKAKITFWKRQSYRNRKKKGQCFLGAVDRGKN